MIFRTINIYFSTRKKTKGKLAKIKNLEKKDAKKY